MLISVPLGFLCAIFLNEIGGPLTAAGADLRGRDERRPHHRRRPLHLRRLGHALFGFSGFAAALAISISMLPIVTRTSEEVLRLVPDGLREASLALGGSEWRTTWSVVLPTARSGLITAVILGVARAVGETAPLIATAFGIVRDEHQPLLRPAGGAAALHLQAGHRELRRRTCRPRAFDRRLVLMVLVLILFTIARLIGRGASRAQKRRFGPATSPTTES